MVREDFSCLFSKLLQEQKNKKLMNTRGLIKQKMQTNVVFGINFLHSWKYYDVLTLRPHDILFET